MPKAKPSWTAYRKEKSQLQQEPETADNFLAAGVELEEAGEKWRGGDAAKSARFFVRAIEKYERGLQQFPASFDLAYNKARVQYLITQNPTLAQQIPTSLVDLLRTALESHQLALKLQQDNADTLFNTAQVLTSLAETVSDEKASIDSQQETGTLLEQALELFQRCLTLQEFQYSESQAPSAAAIPDLQTAGTSETGLSAKDTESVSLSGPSEDEVWATVVEPVTINTLLDTAMAQLDTLTTLCTILAPEVRARAVWSDTEANKLARSLAWIEEYYTDLNKSKISTYAADSPTRLPEVLLARSKFLCSLANSSYRARRIDLATYERELEFTFLDQEKSLDLSRNPEGLCDRAEALIAFCTSLNLFPPSDISFLHPAMSAEHLGILGWKYLTLALDSLTEASKLSTAQNAAKIQLARGDAEMLRFRLSRHPVNLKTAQRSANTIITNAQIYYRGAARFAKKAGMVAEEKEGIVKEAVAGLTGGKVEKWNSLMSVEVKGAATEEIWSLIDEMLEDGLVEGSVETGHSSGSVPLSGAMEYNGGPPGRSLTKHQE